MKSIHPLILCGGMGSRLWPMSRVDQPKQFQPVNGKGSLTYFQTTVQRHRGFIFHDPIIATNAAQSTLVSQQLAEIQTSGLIIGEPVGRNTGPAVLAAALTILPQDPDAVLLVLPSDHIIVGDLNWTMARMVPAAMRGQIIIFGVTPIYAENGYGYIIDGGPAASDAGLRSVSRFVEKPPVKIAQRLIDIGTAYWASGISLFRADVIIEEFRRLEPHTFAAVSKAVQSATVGQGCITLNEAAFRDARDEPTERAIFERSPAIALAPIDVKWDDVGSWPLVYDVNVKSADSNVTSGDVMTLETTNSLIRSDGRLVVVIGMDDVIVVDTKDALLVTDRKNAQLVKLVVEKLKSDGRTEVVSHRYRTEVWGGIEALAEDPDCRMELLTLRSGSTMEINGHGLGASFLSVVSGQATYLEDRAGNSHTLSLGTVLTIDKDTEISLTNTGDHDLQAFLLSITRPGALRPVTHVQSVRPLRAVAHA
jgi:mannose-1-phosphate guanylyltransferase/mannose-6-phosphate isomerase